MTSHWAAGTTGYCMGGKLSLLAAAHHADKVAAAASFHGGNLAVEDDPLLAAACALAVIGVAAECAAKKAVGPGTFSVVLLDALAALESSELISQARIEHDQG